ncbi:GNAT family N-acetyltransferase [Sedimentibacter sp. zth1]|uniref:GNAT family N-acetyltransferase n=1 Tax=Sedimentibacter sp. zth1 TaxID=2816908 RepID=UPI001A913418|nr:GNAT family N-acetyltransferase [Sedimentibacter sp. zth1]QSX07003.1 GNAT family N-acetyltransferase [Sedimentibacter sp. zth1]
MKIPILKTDRLILRPLSVDDAEAVYIWVSDERVTKYMPYLTYTSLDDVRIWLANLQSEVETYNFGFVLKENNLLIGSGDIGYNSEKGAWDFGYNIRYDYWNQGLATEATKCMMKFAYDNFGAKDFSANHAIDNPASGKVMEKCGLKFLKFGEYSKFDQSQTFKAKFYKAHLDEII